MTNAELLAKIKAEIERLIEESDFDESANLYSLLSFLSTLEEQTKGYDESYIQSKIAKASETWKGVDVDEYLSQVRGEVHNSIFDECVANVDPDVREEVRRNIELEEEIDLYMEKNYDYNSEYDTLTPNDGFFFSPRHFRNDARHFYELGCRRTAEKYDEIEYIRKDALLEWAKAEIKLSKMVECVSEISYEKGRQQVAQNLIEKLNSM